MPTIEPQGHPAFDEFVATIAALRNPDGGCPWDLEQTHASIAQNMIEEAYEAVDAIEQDDVPHMREELGDVLLQVVLQSQIAADAGEFTVDDVCSDVNAKIVRRHPHVFGDAKGGSANDVITLWDKIKLQEKQAAAAAAGAGDAASGDAAACVREPGVLDGVPASFPALIQAQKISRKVAAVGFEWETVDDVWAKVEEEVAELKEAYAQAPKDEAGMILHEDADGASSVELEFGDVMFTLVNVARRMGVNAEESLRKTCAKFRGRWEHMEDAAREAGDDIKAMGPDRLEGLWREAKDAEAAKAAEDAKAAEAPEAANTAKEGEARK